MSSIRMEIKYPEPPIGQQFLLRGYLERLFTAVLERIPKGALTLAFIDPTNWQVTFDTVSRLVSGRRMDLIVTFHYGNMRRVSPRDPAVTRFFGTDRWTGGHDAGYWYHLYNQQLEPFGYLKDCYTESETITNSKNVRMYGLVLFTKNRLGRKFWKAASAIDENRQPRMPF